ncbi:glycosyltransferase [Pseudomonadales bacterium]|nr:glycosyltransferase [Pseudomonadales bacterium]
MYPKITIITSTFNCAEALEKTGASIREQDYPSIQWIVADGASSDGTLEVIDCNSDIIDSWFSEPDEGIYDAWNKAVKLIEGEWVIFLGAGDLFFGRSVLTEFWQQVPAGYESHGAVYGNVQYISADGSPRYISRKPNLNKWEFGRPALPHHQGVFQNRRLFENGDFDKTYRIAADSKFMLKALKQNTFLHVDLIVSKMSTDGVSNTLENVPLANGEIRRLCKELDIEVPRRYQLRSSLKVAAISSFHRILPLKAVLLVKAALDRIRAVK